MKKSLLVWLAVATLTPLLSGCFPLAVIGISAGALMVADRRISETYLADEAIEMRANNRLGEMFGSATHINVTSYNRAVLLTGECLSQDARAQAESIVAAVPNVRSVVNELVVAQASTLTERSNDSYITSKVKARFVDSGRFSANHVKVVTERGVVFVFGLVTQEEADASVDVARTTAGVQKVVRLFEIISKEEADKLDYKVSSKPTPRS